MERPFTLLPVCASTNTELKQKIIASPEPVWDVLCAETQTGGRGRRGRSFYSPAGGVYFSAAYPLTGEETNVPFITLLAGLAVAQTLEKLCGAPFMLKWPNDVYLCGKKVCGILTELAAGGARKTAVVGVGINAALPAEKIPPELKDKMTSLAARGLPVPARETVIRETVSALDRTVYTERALCGGADAYLPALERRSYLTGRMVVAVRENAALRGTVLRIAPSGGLVLLTEEGERTVTAGEVRTEARREEEEPGQEG